MNIWQRNPRNVKNAETVLSENGFADFEGEFLVKDEKLQLKNETFWALEDEFDEKKCLRDKEQLRNFIKKN